MKKSDIKVGGFYTSQVDGVVVVVQVKKITEMSAAPRADGKEWKATGYDCIIQKADGVPAKMVGRKVTFESAAKFKSEYVKPVKITVRDGEPEAMGRTKEGEKRPDPTMTATVPSKTVNGADCLGYDPNLVTGRCRCAVCKSKPAAERTTRPFVGATTAEPTISKTAPPTPPSVTSSPPGKTLPSKSEPSLMGSAFAQRVMSEMSVKGEVVPAAGGVKKGILGGMANLAIVQDTAPNIIVEARAGTGKTTTLVEGLKVMLGMGTHLTPSVQQQAVWDALCLSRGKAKTIAFAAFNKSIADELQRRVPPGVVAGTMHKFGFAAVGQYFQRAGTPLFKSNTVNGYKTQNLIEELTRLDREALKKKGQMVSAVAELVGLCKVNLVGYHWEDTRLGARFSPDSIDEEDLDQLTDYFDIDLDGTSRDEVYPLVVKVLHRCLDVGRDRYIDFNDMIWLPVVLNLPVTQYDMLLVDEAQDLNRCQQRFAKMLGERLIFVGDPKQAIYGFAGADCQAMGRLAEELGVSTLGPTYQPRCPKCGNSSQNAIPDGSPQSKRCASCKTVWEPSRGCVLLPLTVTRRCGHAIVKEANKIVQDFSAHDTNPPGVVTRAPFDIKVKDSYHGQCGDGDMVLCRVNAPIVGECFKFIKMGKKANIQGRDVGKGLVKAIQKMKAATVGDLIGKLDQWSQSEQDKELRKKFPSEARVIAIQDRLDCIMAFVDGVDVNASPALVVEKIESVFTDDPNVRGIRLSSIHKAKGLEAKRVFLLEPEGATVPHPMASTPWQKEQEWNLRYVAITRAIEELVFVN